MRPLPLAAVGDPEHQSAVVNSGQAASGELGTSMLDNAGRDLPLSAGDLNTTSLCAGARRRAGRPANGEDGETASEVHGRPPEPLVTSIALQAAEEDIATALFPLAAPPQLDPLWLAASEVFCTYSSSCLSDTCQGLAGASAAVRLGGGLLSSEEPELGQNVSLAEGPNRQSVDDTPSPKR